MRRTLWIYCDNGLWWETMCPFFTLSSPGEFDKSCTEYSLELKRPHIFHLKRAQNMRQVYSVPNSKKSLENKYYVLDVRQPLKHFTLLKSITMLVDWIVSTGIRIEFGYSLDTFINIVQNIFDFKDEIIIPAWSNTKYLSMALAQKSNFINAHLYL